MLEHLSVVLFRPKFSENVGAAARACANMGVRRLVVVDPTQFDIARARVMATSKGGEILNGLVVAESLESAVAECGAVYGTTARIGGWREGLLSPETAAPMICGQLAEGLSVAVVLGPEDAGLTNQEIKLCGRLLTIPTAGGATSLNLAQAVLVVLYEVFKQSLAKPARNTGPRPSRAATHAEREALMAGLKEALLAIDFIKDDNPDYFLLPVRRLIERVGIRRHELNLLMGVCRQIKWAVGAAKGK